MIDINLRGAILGCKLAAERFTRRGGGSIINIASMGGVGGFPGVATYCATKFGVVGLTYALREELHPHRIHVSAILPGVVHTELSAGIRLSKGVDHFVSVEPEDIAAAWSRLPGPTAHCLMCRVVFNSSTDGTVDARTAAPIPRQSHGDRRGIPRMDHATRDSYNARTAAGRDD